MTSQEETNEGAPLQDSCDDSNSPEIVQDDFIGQQSGDISFELLQPDRANSTNANTSPRRPPLPPDPPPISVHREDGSCDVVLKADIAISQSEQSQDQTDALDSNSDCINQDAAESSDAKHPIPDTQNVQLSRNLLQPAPPVENGFEIAARSQPVRPPLPPTPPPRMLNAASTQAPTNEPVAADEAGASNGPAIQRPPSSHKAAAPQSGGDSAGCGSITLQDVYDSLLAAARDGVVSGSAGRSLGRLAVARAGEGVKRGPPARSGRAAAAGGGASEAVKAGLVGGR